MSVVTTARAPQVAPLPAEQAPALVDELPPVPVSSSSTPRKSRGNVSVGRDLVSEATKRSFKLDPSRFQSGGSGSSRDRPGSHEKPDPGAPEGVRASPTAVMRQASNNNKPVRKGPAGAGPVMVGRTPSGKIDYSGSECRAASSRGSNSDPEELPSEPEDDLAPKITRMPSNKDLSQGRRANSKDSGQRDTGGSQDSRAPPPRRKSIAEVPFETRPLTRAVRRKSVDPASGTDMMSIRVAKSDVEGADAMAKDLLGSKATGDAVGKVVDLFRAWDANGDGVISRKELRRLMRFVTDGQAQDEMIEGLMQTADRNKNGSIEFEEFATWIFSPKTGMFSADLAPSKIDSARSPVIQKALSDWFELLDLNNNGTIEYEEFAVACMRLKENVSIEHINEDFENLDNEGTRAISWDQFTREYTRLLDAIPRPLDEKVQLINMRTKRLRAAMEKSNKENDSNHATFDGKELLGLLRQRFGSIRGALEAVWNTDHGVMDIVKFRDTLKQLLGLPDTARFPLEVLRRLWREFDVKRNGVIEKEEVAEVADVAAGRGRRMSLVG